ncbi:hypothetical protein [Streptomyces sp. CA2R101]|uniref:hypothetical protein n=1 Tax=Streptomyces sp. CA2R101 TaxID=3120152 RepID=UPI0030083348
MPYQGESPERQAQRRGVQSADATTVLTGVGVGSEEAAATEYDRATMAETFDFPRDLVDAQLELSSVRSELSALYKRLPWSVEPASGWAHAKEGGRYFESKRPDSPGWTDEEKQQVNDLRARQMELVTSIYVHDFWASCSDPVTARSALKHVTEAGAAPTRDG